MGLDYHAWLYIAVAGLGGLILGFALGVVITRRMDVSNANHMAAKAHDGGCICTWGADYIGAPHAIVDHEPACPIHGEPDIRWAEVDDDDLPPAA